MGEVTLSTGAVLAVTALLGSLATAIGILWTRLDAARVSQIQQAVDSANDRVKREREITDKMLPGVEENTRTLKRWIEIQEAFWERERRLQELQPPTRRLPQGPSE